MVGVQGVALDYAVHAHEAIEAMMASTRHFIGEEAEEEKDIANAHALPPKMRLGSAALSEQAAAIEEHRIFVTQVVRAYPPPRDPIHNITEAQITITGCRATLGWDGQRNRPAVDYW